MEKETAIFYIDNVSKNGLIGKQKSGVISYKHFQKLMNLKQVICVLLLVVLSTQALNRQADADIRRAIKLAVIDGLNTIDSFVRKQYWYYLQGAERTSFNVAVKKDHLNYIILYNTKGLIYRVNSDLDKIRWKPTINSLVRVPKQIQPSSLLKPSISFVNSEDEIVDLTNQINVTPEEVKGNGNKKKAVPTFSQPGPIVITQDGATKTNGIVVIKQLPVPKRPKPSKAGQAAPSLLTSNNSP